VGVYLYQSCIVSWRIKCQNVITRIVNAKIASAAKTASAAQNVIAAKTADAEQNATAVKIVRAMQKTNVQALVAAVIKNR